MMRIPFSHIAHVGRSAVGSMLLVAAFLMLPLDVRAQSDPGPLTFEGLDRSNNHSVASRAFGGVLFDGQADTGLMFANPSGLHGLGGITASFAGYRLSSERSQIQHFAPVRYYPNLSLLLENRTDGIPDPDPDLIGFTPADSVQRPFDDIGPDWSHATSGSLPLHATLAVPFGLRGLDVTAGIGFVQYANLDHVFQNNNTLNPGVLEQRPLPVLRPTDDAPLSAEWYQAVRRREGSIHGYGAALTGHIKRLNLTIGASGLLLGGTSDEMESRRERGVLTFFSNEFRADSSHGFTQGQGTSDFSGSEFTFSGMLRGEHVSLGVVLRPPNTISRTWSKNVETDTSGVLTSRLLTGEDEFRLPWRGSAGMLLQPNDRMQIALEYEVRPYSDATYQTGAGPESNPWVSSGLFRVGISYELTSWLTIRSGIRGDADVFVPDGSAFEDDPVTWRVYSTGVGIHWAGLQWDVAYEFSDMVYEDIWGSAINNNQEKRHTLLTAISYTIPTTF